MSGWINFKGLRESLDFAAVLKHYGVDVKRKGKDQLQAVCPLPNHRGQRQSPSFSVNLSRRIFQCFGCHARGNVLDFAVLMEGKSVSNMSEVQAVAHLLKERFLGGGGNGRSPAARPGRTGEAKRSQKASPPSPSKSPPVVVNAPLDFELKDLDAKHPYLFERGFTAEMIEQFGLGFCARGRFAGRVAIPLRDSKGQLVGYAGRLTKDAAASERNPLYLYPSDRERDGTLHQFRQSLFLYNGNAIASPVSDLIVVQAPESVWWLWQHGYPNIVSLMGSSCSLEQGQLIVGLVEPGGTVWAFTDGDDGGNRCAASILLRVGRHRAVRHVPLGEGEQPSRCSPEDLDALLGAIAVNGGDDASD